MKIKYQAHTVYQTQYHVVWIPKGRRNILLPGVAKYLGSMIYGLIADRYPDVYVSEINILRDHIHALIEIPPKYAVSKIVGYLKGRTSLQLRKKFEFIRRSPSTWSEGYFVSTVGLNESMVRKYIKFQQDQDSGQTEFVWEKMPRAKARGVSQIYSYWSGDKVSNTAVLGSRKIWWV